MNNSKFRVKGYAYLLQLNDNYNRDELSKANIRLTEIHITNIKGRLVEGFQFMRYGYLLDFFPLLKRDIISKPKRRKGKPIEFDRMEFVSVKKRYDASQLCTLEEAKIKMIQFIANDFCNDICTNCTCHEGASY